MCVNSLELFFGQNNIHYLSVFKNDTKCIFSCLLFSQLTGPYSLSWFPSKDKHCRNFYIFWQKKIKNTNKHNSKTIQKLFLFRVLKSAQTWVTNPWILLLYTIDLSWNGEGFINYSSNASCVCVCRSALLLDLHRLTACSWQYTWWYLEHS